jgi:hypothetical protein
MRQGPILRRGLSRRLRGNTMRGVFARDTAGQFHFWAKQRRRLPRKLQGGLSDHFAFNE